MALEEKDRLETFKRLFEANVSGLVQFARRFTLSELAEDVVQDVFLELWGKKVTLNEQSAKAFLFAAVRNRCINLLKHEQIKTAHQEDARLENQLLGLDYLDSPEKQLIDREERQRLFRQIDQLPEKCRQIFKLAYFEDKRNDEIAEQLHLSKRTVEHQLYLGLKTLREKMTRK